MSIFLALLKKEAIEHIRTKKLTITLVLFVCIGLLSPLTAKLTPRILQSIATGTIDIRVPEPTEIDAWIQFFKNINQIGMFGLAILLSTQVANEFQRATLINLLSKGLPRSYVVVSKWMFDAAMWLLSYSLCFFVALGYTNYFFGIAFPVENILMAAFLPFVFGLFLISVEILGGVVTGNVIGTLVFTITGILVQLILSLRDEIVKYMPIALVGKPVNLIKGIGFDDYFTPVMVTGALIVVCIALSIIAINKKQMV